MQSKPANAVTLERINPCNPRPGFETAMIIETNNILRHSLFVNSPTMTRLLIWLMRETLAGRGDKVKSYTIAVDALGRSDNFDSQSDSYPRVQTSRLRKALENYYAQRGPLQDLCVYLQPGSYRLRLAKLEMAYPQLYRPLSREPSPAPAVDNRSLSDTQALAQSASRANMTELPTSVLAIILISLGFLAGLALILIL